MSSHLWERKKRLNWMWLNILILMILYGCVTPPKVRRHKRPPLNPQHILEQIHSRSLNIRDLSGFSKFHISSRGKKQSGTIAINLKKDTFLRLGFLNLFGQPIHYFLADEKRLLSYNPGEKSAVSGKPDARNVKRLIGVRMEVESFVSFLLGDPLDLNRFYPESVIYESDTDRYLFLAEETSGTGKLWVDPDTFSPVQYHSYDKNGSIRILTVWDNFRRIGNISFPTKIIIELPQEKTIVNVQYTDFDLNSELAPEIFSLEIPSETKTVLLEP
jgi:outer membrane lipoprotein-sorting protein